MQELISACAPSLCHKLGLPLHSSAASGNPNTRKRKFVLDLKD
jgi:hypothetical protein